MKPNNLNSPKIIIVSNALSGGGAEKSMVALHKSFLEKGINSNLVALNQSTKFQKISFSYSLGRNWKSGVIHTWKNFLEFRELVKTMNPDMLILNCELPELYGVMLMTRKRLICVEHTSKPWAGKKILGFVVRFTLKIKRAEWVTVINEQQKIWISGQKPTYIPNPFISQVTKKRKRGQDAGLTFIGSLKPNKRPDWVIETGLKLDLNIQLFGEGDMRKLLQKQYLKYSNQVKFFGFISNPWDLISSKSLVIIPSDYEGDGMVIVEAVLLGNPILLRDNKDLRRFGFGDKYYFKDLNQLIDIVEANSKSNFKNLYVSQSNVNQLKVNRSLQKITQNWINLINT